MGEARSTAEGALATAADLKHQLEAVTSQGGRAETLLESTTALLSEAEAQVRALTSRCTTADATVEELQKTVNSLQAESSASATEAVQLREAVVGLRDTVQRGVDEMAQVRRELDCATDELCAASRERDSVTEELQGKMKEGAELEATIKSLQEELEGARAKEARLTGVLEEQRLSAEAMADSADKSQALVANQEARLVCADEKLAQQASELTHAHAQCDALRVSITDKEAQWAEARCAMEQKLDEAQRMTESSKADAAQAHGAMAAEVEALREELSIARVGTQTAQEECEEMAEKLDVLREQLARAREDVVSEGKSVVDALKKELAEASAALHKAQTTVKTTKAEAFSTELSLKNQLREAVAAEERGKARETATKSQLARVRTELTAALDEVAATAQVPAQLSSALSDLQESQRLYESVKAAASVAETRNAGLEEQLTGLKRELELLRVSNVEAQAAAAASAAAARDREELHTTTSTLKAEVRRLKQQLQASTTQLHALEDSAAEAAAENARLCGHQNTKQKIHQHMQLKKDIQDQAVRLKAQQAELEKVTLERNELRAELEQSHARGAEDVFVEKDKEVRDKDGLRITGGRRALRPTNGNGAPKGAAKRSVLEGL